MKFPERTGAALRQIWQIRPGRESEPPERCTPAWNPPRCSSRATPATAGRSYEGLWDHPQRPRWQPGGGGLCLHTILLDPERRDRIRIAVSTGGHVRDRRWRHDVAAVEPPACGPSSCPTKYPEFGQCVHKVAQSRESPAADVPPESLGPLSQRRSRRELDRTSPTACRRISDSRSRPTRRSRLRLDRAARIRRVPLHAGRTPAGLPHARCRSAMGGASRAGCRRRAHTRRCCATALAVDALDPAGVYFGTRSGRLYGSADEGSTWSAIVEGLPPIVSVKAAIA